MIRQQYTTRDYLQGEIKIHREKHKSKLYMWDEIFPKGSHFGEAEHFNPPPMTIRAGILGPYGCPTMNNLKH